MFRKIRWGILGYARIAKLSTIPAIINAKNAELYGIASRDEDKLNECKKRYDFKKTYSTYDELLDDPEIDSVYIPLPNSLHKEWVIKAAKKGKHILCEKPIALNTKEVIEMKKVSEENNVLLMEGFMYRYTNRTQKVLEILDSGIIGNIKYIRSTFRFFLDRENTIKMKPELGGGSIYDVGCYPLDFINMIMKRDPTSVSSEYLYRDNVDTMFTGILKYDNDVIAVLESSFNTFDRMYTEIIGTEGLIEIPDTFLDIPGAITVHTKDGVKDIIIEKSERYTLEIEDFSDAILNDKKPLISLDESINNMKIMDKLLASR